MNSELVQRGVLTLNANTPDERIAEAIGQVKALKAFAREVEAALKERMLEIIEERRSDITIGTIRYYAGVERKTKCSDVAGAVEQLLIAAGGDPETFCAFLASDAIKPGAAKAALGDRWRDYFTVEERPKLEEGKPKKQLLEMNTAYLR